MRKEECRAAFKRNVGRALQALLVCAVAGAVIIGCKSTGSSDEPPAGFRITKFMIEETEGIINQNDRTIEVVMPYGTVIGEFEPTVEFVGARIDPEPGTIVDFTEQPVRYTVYWKDGSAFAYLVTVTVEIPNTKEILSFELEGVITAEPASIIDVDEDSAIINLTVPYGTDVSNRTAIITHSGDSIDPVAGKPQDFRNTTVYTVYSLQGERRTYMVNVSIAPNTEALITRFTINSAEGDIDGTDIEVWVPFGTNLTALTPVIEMSAGATVSPTGTQDFSNGAVTYRVKAADNTTITSYTVTVKVSPNTAKEITAFTIPGQEKYEINGTDITVTLPANMPKNPLTPTIVFTGSSVTPASGVAQNFSSPVSYTVKAADNSTKIYTVTVTNAAATAVTFNSVTANGASWATETTLLTLNFSADMGDALKAEHITIDPALTKVALTNIGSGKYELAVNNILGNNVLVSVTPAANAVYGFTITGGAKTAYVYKSPVEVAWSDLTADGANGTQTTNKLTFTFDKDIALTPADITLTGAGAAKGTVTGSGTTRTLTISGINANNADLIVSLDKQGFAFTPQTSRKVTVYKKLGTDATLQNLTVDGFTLDPAFDKDTLSYTVEVVSEVIHITATASDPNSRMVYEENSNATVTSGESFDSKPLPLEGSSTVTIKVTAEDGTAKRYALVVKHSDFPSSVVIDQTFTVNSTAKWENAVDDIKNGGDNKNYVIDVTGDFDVAGVSSANFGSTKYITVFIRGSEQIGLSSNGSLISVGNKQTLILRDVTLKGWTNNQWDSVVSVESGGVVEMRGSAKITGNTKNGNGGGVAIDGGTFTMRDNASVSGNTATYSGGVFIGYSGVFIMRDNASVSGNTADEHAGGVRIDGGTFTMRDNASVFGNTVNDSGSGVLAGGTFRMAGGTVYGLDAANGLKNTNAALDGGGEYGTGGTDGEAWVKNGDLNETNNTIKNTIKVVNGVLQ